MKKITDLDISTRAKNALKEAGIDTLNKLKNKTKEDLLEIDGIGKKTAEELAVLISEKKEPEQQAEASESLEKLQIPAVEELIKAGVHFGHQHRRWHPASKKYIFTTEKGLDIFDLEKTQANLEKAARFLNKQARKGATFLFVGTKRQSRDVITEIAEEAGVFYINDRWIGGLLTNFSVVRKNWEKLSDLRKKRSEGFFQDLTKKEILLIDREIEKLDRLYGGLVGMEEKPDVLVLASARKSKTPVEEANAGGVKTVAVVDSNFDPNLVTYPIPGNDDSRGAIRLLMKTLAKAVIIGGENGS